MKEAFYFSHDSNARNDPKIMAMRSVYGAEGYGWYWMIVEMLREEESYRLPLGRYIFHALALQMQCTPDAAEKFLRDCIEEFELFDSDGERFWSNSLLKRMELKESKAEQARAAAAARWSKSGRQQSRRNANAIRPHSDSTANKGKEKKDSLPPIVPPDDPEAAGVVDQINATWEREAKTVLNPFQLEELEAPFLGDGALLEVGMLVEAIRVCRERKGGEVNPEYTAGILRGWRREGKRTVADLARARDKPDEVSMPPLDEGSDPKTLDPNHLAWLEHRYRADAAQRKEVS